MSEILKERSDWKAKGRSGKFHIWHAGKNTYYVTDGENGEIVGHRNHYGSAFSLACHHDLVFKNYGGGIQA